MKKNLGVILGFIAGVIDIIPMIIQGLTWDANLSALSMWTVTGFIISRINMNVHPILKGIIVSMLILLPCAFLIAWNDPIALIPIVSMNLILGGLLGFFINKFGRNK